MKICQSVAHCATRLRIMVNKRKFDKEAIRKYER